MNERFLPEVQVVSEYVAQHLFERSVRPVFEPTAVQRAIGTSMHYGTPLRLRTVLCPNWTLDASGRSIQPIPVRTEGAQLIYDDPDLNIVGFTTEELPNLLTYFNRQGVRTELLVVLADILSPDWVHDPRLAEAHMRQNLKALKLLIMSSDKGHDVFRDSTKNTVRIASQDLLSKTTPQYGPHLKFIQTEMLEMGTHGNEWYLHTLRELQKIGEYADKRTGVSGMKKVWERAFFLAGMYALDGKVIEGDFERARFAPYPMQGYLELGAVATPHGDLIAQGLNVYRPEPVGLITPFNNAMEHSWSERRKEAVVF